MDSAATLKRYWKYGGEAATVGRNRCIYFIQSDGKDNPIKIGYSENVEKRLAGLDGAIPDNVELLTIIPGGSRKQERQLHEYFARYHKKGEWFFPGEELVSYIAKVKRDLESFKHSEIPEREEVSEELPIVQQVMRDFEETRKERKEMQRALRSRLRNSYFAPDQPTEGADTA